MNFKKRFLFILSFLFITLNAYSKTMNTYKIEGKLDLEKGCKLPATLIVHDGENTLLYQVSISDTEGRFSFYFKPGTYHLISYTKPKCWARRKTIKVSKIFTDDIVINLKKSRASKKL